MDAVTTVFETIKAVLAIIKDFFESIFPKKDAE